MKLFQQVYMESCVIRGILPVSEERAGKRPFLPSAYHFRNVFSVVTSSGEALPSNSDANLAQWSVGNSARRWSHHGQIPFLQHAIVRCTGQWPDGLLDEVCGGSCSPDVEAALLAQASLPCSPPGHRRLFHLDLVIWGQNESSC